jgi:hypothetical protein
MVELREFFQGGEILNYPLVLIGFVVLVLYLVVKVLEHKLDPYAASDVSMGLLVVVGIVVVLGFSLQFFQSCNPKGYFVVAVFASSNKAKTIKEVQKLRKQGFNDVNYIWVQERQLFKVYVGESHQCLWECEKISELKKSIIAKTSYKDAYIWRLPSK